MGTRAQRDKMKWCKRCRREKYRETEFRLRKPRRGGRKTYESICKDCERVYHRQHARDKKRDITEGSYIPSARNAPNAFDGPKLVAWIRKKKRMDEDLAWIHQGSHHGGGMAVVEMPPIYMGSELTRRRLYDWAHRQDRRGGPSLERVDEVLCEFDLHINEIPAECWLDPEQAWLD